MKSTRALRGNTGKFQYSPVMVPVGRALALTVLCRGCVTPKQFSNIIQSLEDAGMEAKDLDGFEELSEENQEKIVNAIEAGHVDDADWKGVCYLLLPVSGPDVHAN
jgi:hypothetical protein